MRLHREANRAWQLWMMERPLVLAMAAAALLVLARSAVFLWWEQAGFDSDQAIFGLMAKHMAEGRGYSVFIYGAPYMLGLQAWLAAPLFAVFGPSVAVLKVPVVLVNVATSGLLVWILHRECGLRPFTALLASLFYVLAAPALAASLIETGGGNPEPFLYVLLLWLLRGRPLAFGVVFGIGFLHREFTLYGLTAIVGLALLNDPRVTAERLRAIALASYHHAQSNPRAVMYGKPLDIVHRDVSPENVLISYEGEVKIGTNLELLYFDQLRNQLELDKSIIDNLCEGRDFIEINGKQRHVISYLQDFLFVPARMRQPVKSLSGGEQNRLILAKLFSKPANLIVLDEPTNDLDMETLELLEEILLEFSGTILLVSHDRRFLDNVVTSSIVFEGNGVVKEYVGGYQDWVNQGGKLVSFADQGKEAKEAKAEAAPVAVSKPVEKPKLSSLTSNEKRELDLLPKDIEKLEQKVADLEQVIAGDGFFAEEQKKIDSKLAELAKFQNQLETMYARWEALLQK